MNLDGPVVQERHSPKHVSYRIAPGFVALSNHTFRFRKCATDGGQDCGKSF